MKVGKTSLSAQFPKALLLGFEHGWNALAGVNAIDVTKWIDFKRYLRELEEDQAKEKFETIIIDTVGIAWDLCSQYICMQHGVKELGDIPWGLGFSKATKEFEQSLRKITQLGYGLVILAHVDTTVEKRPDGSEVQILGPAIPKRCYNIVNQLVDVIGYIDITWDENGNSHRWLQTRKTPTVMAGSRFKYLAPRIKFGYQELVDAINEAIDKEQAEGATVVDKIVTSEDNNAVLDFKSLRTEAQNLWNELVHPTENPDVNKAERITKIISEVMGTQVKLSEITESQVDFLNEIVQRIKTEVKG